jgi:hypothetical protein
VAGNELVVGHWIVQAFPVLLVIRTSEGEVRWMEVRDWLKRASDDGKKPVKQMVFEFALGVAAGKWTLGFARHSTG